jgi:hypothetical protein
MVRLPIPGSDDGQWGDILNNYLSVSHQTDGTLKPLAQSQVANLTTNLAAKANATDLAPVATSGSYVDLANKPTIPTGTDASLLTAGTVADARLPVTAQAATLSAAYAARGAATTLTPADAMGGGPGLSAALLGVDVPMFITGQGVAYGATDPIITDGSGTPYTLADAYVAIPFQVPAGQSFAAQALLALTTIATPDFATYLVASIWSDSGGAPGTNLSAATGATPIPYFIRTGALAPATQYWLVLHTTGVTSTFKMATTAGAGVTVKTSPDGTTWTAGATVSLAYGLFNAGQPGVQGHSNGYVGIRGDSGSSIGGVLEGAGGYYGVYGTGGSVGIYGHSHGQDGVYGDSVHGFGVHGNSLFAGGAGVRGESTNGPGVWGVSGGGGVRGDSTSTYAGVLGTNSGAGPGLWGDNTSAGGTGVYGRSVPGTGYGVVADGFFAVISGYPPSPTAGSSAGGTPPAPVLPWPGCQNSKGSLTFGTGSAPSAGPLVAIAFGQTAPASPTVIICPANAAAAALSLYVASVSATGFTIASAVAPAASQANTVYAANYWVVG